MGQKQCNTTEKKWKQLSERERYQIEALDRKKITPGEIGRQLGRDRRTIERELARGRVEQRDYEWRERFCYCADAGQRVTERNAANKGRPLKIGYDHKLARHIEEKIGKEKYAPDAVIGEIKAKGLRFNTVLCTKTVYNYIDRGLFLNISNKDLPVKKDKKSRKYRAVRSVALNNRLGRSIDERPENIENRMDYGHWEMDCVVGKGKACLLVLTERQSRREKIFKLGAKTQKEVIAVLDKLERECGDKFRELFKSVTMDNGCEFLDSEGLEKSCLNPANKRMTCYYAHPYSAWERGSNEVANKLIRRFVPKGSDIDSLTEADIRRIERWINNYPRRMFGYKTSNDFSSTAA
jgi:transposase, IS30 family